MKIGTTRSSLTLTFALALIAALGLGITQRTGYAASGDLDTTFGGDGKVTSNFSIYQDEIGDVAIQDDGKVLAVGSIQTDRFRLALVRYLPNGDMDTTFGVGGVATADLTGAHMGDLVIQPDHKIVVVGFDFVGSNNDIAVARFLANGDLDTTFGGDGMVTIAFHGSDYATSVALQTDNKILVGGYDDDGGADADFVMARLNSNGSLDSSFDGDGKWSHDFFGGEDEIRSIALQADGKIVAVGNTYLSGDNYDFALARLNPDGTPDSGFDSDGFVLTDFFGGDDGAYDLAIQPNGAIVVAGSVYYAPTYYNFGVARYLPNGSLDPSFGVNGIKAENIGGGDSALAVSLQSDGKILMAGDATGQGQDFAVARFTTNGFLDPSFSGDGFTTADILGEDDTAYGMAIQPDGKIVLGGASHRVGTDYDFALARFISGLETTPTPTPVPTNTNTPQPTQTTGGPTATTAPSSTRSPTRTATRTPTQTTTQTPTFTQTAATPTPTSVTTCNTTQQFEDVPPDSTFYAYVEDLTCRSIISGYPCGSVGEPCVGPGNLPYFRPQNRVSRAQLAKIVSNAAGYNEDHNGQTFQDVPAGSTFYLFVERLAGRGVIGGYACGSVGEPCIGPGNLPYFRPNAEVTRGQTSKIVASARNLPAPQPGQQSFQDVPEASTFWQWIEALATDGAIGGYPCGTLPLEPCVPPDNRPYFRPASQVTRGQASKIVSNAFSQLSKKE